MQETTPFQRALNSSKDHLSQAWRDCLAVGTPEAIRAADSIAYSYQLVAHALDREASNV